MSDKFIQRLLMNSVNSFGIVTYLEGKRVCLPYKVVDRVFSYISEEEYKFLMEIE